MDDVKYENMNDIFVPQSIKIYRYPFGLEEKEIDTLRTKASAAERTLLNKSHDDTWSNTGNTKTSDLDHVISSNDLQIQQWYNADDPSTLFEINVDGWVNLSGSRRSDFLQNISDHSLLYGEVL